MLIMSGVVFLNCFTPFGVFFYDFKIIMKKLMLIIFSCITFFACNHRIETNRSLLIKKDIDISEAKKFIKLSEVFDSISIIPLQTGPDCLIGKINSIFMNDSHIFILDIVRESLYIFSRDGKFVNKICNVGKGPGEYTDVLDFFIDNEKKQIILLAAGKIQFYSLDNFKLLSEFPKGIFGVQYWYLGKNIFAAYEGNMSTDNAGNNLVLFKKNKIIKEYLPIRRELKGYNYSLKNNFSLKNDYNNTYFSLPFESVIYSINPGAMKEEIYFKYTRNTIPKTLWTNSDISNLTEKIVGGGYCYGEEDFYKDDDFFFFKFRGEKKVFQCFMDKNLKLNFSNVIIDDLTCIPFHGFQFGSLSGKFLTSFGDNADIQCLLDILRKNPTYGNILNELPEKLLSYYKSSDIDSNPFVICYHY